MEKLFAFVAYWCFPVIKDCFERSFLSKTERFLPFSRTENAQKTLENNVSSNVHGLVILKKCDFFWRLLAVCIEIACCYRRFTTRTRLFTRIFTKLPIDYRAENGIYSHIHRRFTPLTIRTSIDMFIVHMCFGEALFSSIKKNKQTNKQKQPHHFTRVCRFASHKLWCVEL